jgi:NAD(P)-dependent dehydrogenase (short-subunit alcohol dehydrogenase family)
MGANVAIIGHDKEQGESAQNEIKSKSGNPKVDLLLADLWSQAEIRKLAEDIQARYQTVHVLINNAGIAPIKRSVTVDGIERVFAVNYLAPFLLTNLLLERLKASAPARVVNVAGDFHRKATIQFDDLMSEKDYNGNRANNQAKLALILFTYELARRLDGTGVTANCLHPGAVATDGPLKDPDLPAFSRAMYKMVRLFFASPERGAETSIYLSTSPEVEKVSGKYFIKKTPVESSPESYDEEIARRLWKVSEELTSLVK